MKKVFIAGNWKSFKRSSDALAWFEIFNRLQKESPISNDHLTTVLCPGYLLMPLCAEKIKQDNLPIELGAQDVSHLGEGAFTGEISALQIAEFVSWSIIGHSERRRNLGETDALLFKKVQEAKKHGLRIIYCVQDEAVEVPSGVDVIAYEPPWAISAVSGGIAQNPESANRVVEKFVSKYPSIPVIYGGSVTPDNVSQFVEQPAISGVLPGGASLEADKFFRMMVALTAINT